MNFKRQGINSKKYYVVVAAVADAKAAILSFLIVGSVQKKLPLNYQRKRITSKKMMLLLLQRQLVYNNVNFILSLVK